MSVYRHIHINYWQDAFILELTPEEKYFYIYLLTNSKTKQCGLYELPSRIIETETGYNKETIEKLISRFEEYEKIVYDKTTKEIYVKNWPKHNKMTSVKVRKCVEKELSKVKSEKLIKLFLKEASKYGYEFDIDINNTSTHTASNTKYQQINEDTINESNSMREYSRLYEQNIGLINGIAKDWLIEISKTIDVEIFKRAIEIATDKGKCNKGYINGIINQWISNNIKTINDLKAFEANTRNKGENSYANNKPKPIQYEEECIYKEPTDEQLEQARRLLDGI